MVDILSDQEIEHLVGEKKSLPYDYLANIQQAVSCLINDCGFVIPSGTQRPLFEEAGI